VKDPPPAASWSAKELRYAAGGSLHHVIAVADAISYAHRRRIIHRDLKPANIIVGDFGETVVIDWGLAKELSDPEDPQNQAGARGTPDDGVTSAGAVLGTPIYMAPEQERGEPVDQRADVFAIGAMLWELCALQRVPPFDPRHRHRLLQRAGIDQDLMAIIDKAIDPAPARRYPDAGALAADLKAFKSGARIAARSYSLPAMIAHWTRRHRAMALVATAMRHRPDSSSTTDGASAPAPPVHFRSGTSIPARRERGPTVCRDRTLASARTGPSSWASI
jgi:serine/threonine protein kinase